MNLLDPNKVINDITMTSQERILGLHYALEQIDLNQIPGDVVECGVWRGGNIIISKTALDSVDNIKHYWAYDTYAGMTQPSAEDPAAAHDNWRTSPHVVCLSPLEEVQANFVRYGVADSRIHTIVGDVAHTLLQEDNLPKSISLLRLDTDWYASTLLELQVLWPRLESGGFLIIDDYGYWSGCRQAVQEYFGRDFVLYNFVPLDDTGIMYRKP